MDWIAIVVAAVMGGLGAGLGALLARPIGNKTVRTVVTVVCFAAAGAVGRIYVAPWAVIEFAFVSTPELQSLAKMAPDHVDELKARMREVYRRGGGSADYERVGSDWGRKYSAKPLMALMASRNDGLVLRSFETYLAIFKVVYQHNPRLCFDWIEGVGNPTSGELGLGPTDKERLFQLLRDTNLLNQPENAPVADRKLPQDLSDAVIARVQKNWDAARIDFAAAAKPSTALPGATKAKVCYTTFAIFSEIEALPVPDRLRYLRGMFSS